MSAQGTQPDSSPPTGAVQPQTQTQTPSQTKDSEQAYEGPSILSRDRSLLGERAGKLIDFRLYGEVTGIYDSGLTPVKTNAAGDLITVGANYGVEAGFGVIGSRKWLRDQLSLEYKGSYRTYSAQNYFNSFDQFLNLAYARSLKRRLTLDIKETAGITSLANGTYAYTPLTNVDLFTVPNNELFDARTIFMQSRVDLTWQKSARLSFSIGGEGFLVRRDAVGLAGLTGYVARANVAYRLSRRQTVSGAYAYTYYDFQKAFGDAKLQTATLGYSVGLSRRWELAADAGATRVEAAGLTQVNIDPAIAIIIGQNVAVVSYFRIVQVPTGDLRLVRRFDRSSLSMGYSIGAVPGNGVYLTSKQNAASVNYSYAGFRKVALGVNAAYGDLSTVGQSLGKYRNYTGGFGVTYKVGRDVHMETRYDYRHYTTQNAGYQKDSQRISVGFAFSPGETPLAIW
jgi:hypothetical protein